MTTIVNLVPEPPVFDTGNKTLSAHWVDWYVGAHKCSSEEAIKVANAKLREVLGGFPSTYIHLAPDSAASLQLRDLELDITQYFNAFEYFESLHEKKYFSMLKDDDPSLFSSNVGDKLALKNWLVSKANELNVSAQSLQPMATFMVMGAQTVAEADIDFTKDYPLASSIPGIPSMKWVLYTRFKYGIKINEAHDQGVDLLKPRSVPGELKA